MRPAGAHLFRVCYSKPVSLHHQPLAETQRQTGNAKAPQWGGGGGALTRKGASSVIGLGEIIQLFLVRPELEAREKIRETLSLIKFCSFWANWGRGYMSELDYTYDLTLDSLYMQSLVHHTHPLAHSLTCEKLTNSGKARDTDLQ